MVTEVRAWTAMLAGAWLIAGCSTPGLLYTDITLPLTLDMSSTQRAPDSTAAIQRIIREPLTGAGIRAEWSDDAPGNRARIGGLDRVSYADVRSNSVLGGIWGSTTVLVYGDRQQDPGHQQAREP
jgi:hypothetical protein